MLSLTAKQYADMSDLVEYAEVNSQIKLDPAESETAKDLLERPAPLNSPNDPMFADQWALNNAGQNGGKPKADIAALLAWEKPREQRKLL